MFGIGMSGARIEFGNGSVHKYGNERVLKQGMFCLQHRAPCLPFTMAVWRSGEEFVYSMKRYNELSTANATPEYWILLAQQNLQKYLWNQKAVDIDPRWKEKLLHSLTPELRDWALDVIDEPFEPCVIHGDPTLDNFALDPHTGTLVVLDPIPYEGKIPPWDLVDYGKLIQSVLGYEFLKYPDKEIQAIREPIQFIENKLMRYHNARQIDIALFWTAVHMERMLPYADSSRVRNFAILTRNYLIHNRYGRGSDRLKECGDRVLQSCRSFGYGETLGESSERVGDSRATQKEERAVSGIFPKTLQTHEVQSSYENTTTIRPDGCLFGGSDFGSEPTRESIAGDTNRSNPRTET